MSICMPKAEDSIRAELVATRGKITDLQRRETELELALRVLEEGATVVGATALPRRNLTAGEKKQMAFGLLGEGPGGAKTPATVHAGFVDAGITTVNVDNIRTILWRAARSGEIAAERGRYWKKEEGA